MLTTLSVRGLGPAHELDWNLGSRLSLIVGDNGLGKTLLLDIVWWVITGQFAGEPLRGDRSRGEPSIRWSVTGHSELVKTTRDYESTLRQGSSATEWSREEKAVRKSKLDDGAEPTYSLLDDTKNGGKKVADHLTIYARHDGSFEVFDPIRPKKRGKSKLHFSTDEIWHGPQGAGSKNVVCRGLIEDWRSWQYEPDKHAQFAMFTKILEHLSEPGCPIKPATDKARIPGDAREIPMVQLPYGVESITQLSAGMRRILSLSYLLVWAWGEHVVNARELKLPRSHGLTLLIDEAELHLHPRWQRSLLPALMQMAMVPDLFEGLRRTEQSSPIQIIATTHAPLVLASVESIWKDDLDSLLRYELVGGHQVVLHQEEIRKEGEVANWLTSPAFGLIEARSREAEDALIKAEALMSHASALTETVVAEQVRALHPELKRVLPNDDPFWTRWIGTYRFLDRRGT